jgi:hypothetical protein
MKDLIKKAYENNLPVVTRGGTKAEIVYIAEDCGTYSVVIRCKGELEVRTADGHIFENKGSEWDIVGLWEEKTYPIGSIFHVVGSTVMLTQTQADTFKLVSLGSGNRYSDRVVNKPITGSKIDFLAENGDWTYAGQFDEVYKKELV